MKSTDIANLKMVRDIMNTEDNLTPYEWADNKDQSLLIEKSLNTISDKGPALTEIMESVFSIFVKRAIKLFEIKAPPSVIINECESFVSASRKIHKYLGDGI